MMDAEQIEQARRSFELSLAQAMQPVRVTAAALRQAADIGPNLGASPESCEANRNAALILDAAIEGAEGILRDAFAESVDQMDGDA